VKSVVPLLISDNIPPRFCSASPPDCPRLPRLLSRRPNDDSHGRARVKPLLDGITILDFSMVIAGPYRLRCLAEMGRRVIKIDATPEREQTISTGGMALIHLKELRRQGSHSGQPAELGRPANCSSIDRAVRCPAAQFPPGCSRRLLSTGRPAARSIRVLFTSTSERTAHPDRIVDARAPTRFRARCWAGPLRQAGRGNPPPPDKVMDLEEIKEVSRLLMRANEANPDPNTSQAVATGILLALLARGRTGRGQSVEVTMLQGNAWANADEAYDYNGRPPCALPDDQCYGTNALYRLYGNRRGLVFPRLPVRSRMESIPVAR